MANEEKVSIRELENYIQDHHIGWWSPAEAQQNCKEQIYRWGTNYSNTDVKNEQNREWAEKLLRWRKPKYDFAGWKDMQAELHFICLERQACSHLPRLLPTMLASTAFISYTSAFSNNPDTVVMAIKSMRILRYMGINLRYTGNLAENAPAHDVLHATPKHIVYGKGLIPLLRRVPVCTRATINALGRGQSADVQQDISEEVILQLNMFSESHTYKNGVWQAELCDDWREMWQLA